MKLKSITPENILKLHWYDYVYILSKPLEDFGNSPVIFQILPFFELGDKINLTDGNYYYFSKAVKYY